MIGSHNSWTYLRPRKLWQKVISFSGRCQTKDIFKQYESGVRCFDLRLKRDNRGKMCITHGLLEYDIPWKELYAQFEWLDRKGDVYVRVLHDVRRVVTVEDADWFRVQCAFMEARFTKIRFFSGRNLVDWNIDYFFKSEELEIDDFYGSVCSWYGKIWPWIWAKTHSKKETDKDVLLMDFL